MKASIRNKIIEALKQDAAVDKHKLDGVLESWKKSRREEDFVARLADEGVISEKDLMIVLSKELDIPPIDLTRIKLESSVMGLLPEKLARKYNVVPVSRIGDSLMLAIHDPTDILAVDDVKTVSGCEVRLVLATGEDLERTLRNYYEGEEEDYSAIIDETLDEETDVEVMEKAEGMDISDIAKKSKTAPIVKMVSLVITEAIKKRASDIHIEPQEKALRIRYRVDGELQEAFELPKKNQNAVIARLKIMSNLDITENRMPQDGRFRIKTEGKEIDFRVSALPCSFGNKFVLRALDKSNLSFGLEALGFLPNTLEAFTEALAHPFGIILVTGPTGSGKSTTLYSVLNELNVPERNIITVEDPVEYQLGGITQIPANADIGLDFAAGLRSILRQSPDVIMVGEIRDFETADIAIKASLTGHLVLSTLHTNDAVGAITRMVNMGIEPFLIASSLVMTCAQRLLRKICPHCKVQIQVPEEVLKGLRETYPDIMKEAGEFYKGKGCAKCNNTGYLGRMGTLETVIIDDEIKAMINKRKSETEIKKYLKEKGVRTLRENAIAKFVKGWTTLEEVLRVT